MNLTPGEAGMQHKTIESVTLRPASPCRHECALEPFVHAGGGQIDAHTGDTKVVDPYRSRGQCEFRSPFVEHPYSEVGQHGEQVGQINLGTGYVHFEPSHAGRSIKGYLYVHFQLGTGHHPFGVDDVRDGQPGGGDGGEARRKDVLIARIQIPTVLVAALINQRIAQRIAPRTDRIGEVFLHLFHRHITKTGHRRQVDHEMNAGQR